MTDILVTLLVIFAFLFLICFVVGIFRARKDIKKHKNDDCSFRRSRKEVIFEKLNDNNSRPVDNSVLSRLSNLTDEERQEFERQLLERFNAGGSDDKC